VTPASLARTRLDAAELDAIIAGVAVLAVQLVIPHPDICSIEAISQLDVADAALEAVDVVEEQQRLDDHGSAATCLNVDIHLVKGT